MKKLKKLALITALTMAAPLAFAASCEVTIEGNDAMQYNLDTLEFSQSCDTINLTLEHTGSLPVDVMGHNVVIAHSEDIEGVSDDGLAAGLDNDYVKPDDERVVAHTDMIGGGESTTIEISMADFNIDEEYEFFCSFPGHHGIMKGDIKFVD